LFLIWRLTPLSNRQWFGKVSNIGVHFLPCNQIFIDYAAKQEKAPEIVKKQCELFAPSQKRCTPRPSVTPVAEYRRYKNKLNAMNKSMKINIA
jgi:hypothetical protein